MTYAAPRLFVQRAVAAAPTSRLTAGNSAAVARICHQLDGIPLALELAATRVEAIRVEQVDERLRDWFALLTRGSRAAASERLEFPDACDAGARMTREQVIELALAK